MRGYLGGYALIGLLALVGVVFAVAGLAANRLLRPRNPTPTKLLTYECGVDPVGAGWAQTQVRYFVFAFFYVVFAVESVFLFPFAVIARRHGLGWVGLAEMGLFVVFLTAALGYAWRRKVLTWV